MTPAALLLLLLLAVVLLLLACAGPLELVGAYLCRVLHQSDYHLRHGTFR